MQLLTIKTGLFNFFSCFGLSFLVRSDPNKFRNNSYLDDSIGENAVLRNVSVLSGKSNLVKADVPSWHKRDSNLSSKYLTDLTSFMWPLYNIYIE
jgi:hypothetical protein